MPEWFEIRVDARYEEAEDVLARTVNEAIRQRERLRMEALRFLRVNSRQPKIVMDIVVYGERDDAEHFLALLNRLGPSITRAYLTNSAREQVTCMDFGSAMRRFDELSLSNGYEHETAASD